MWYNITALNGDNVLTFVVSTSDLFVKSSLGILILVVLFFVSFLNLNYYWNDTKMNLVISFFVVGLLGSFFSVISLVPIYIVIILVILFFMSLLALWLVP